MLLSRIHANPAVAEARALHGRCASGRYIAIARHNEKIDAKGRRGFEQRFYPAHAIEGICTALGSAPDTYMSQASFALPRRIASATSALNCAFIDLDAYNVGLQPDAAALVLEKIAANAGMPQPSIVVSSGRGIYAKWIFDQPISSDLLPQWSALQNILAALFDPLGADTNAKDAARVLRVLGTINTKSRQAAQVLRDTGQRHNFSELCRIAREMDLPDVMRQSRRSSQTVRRAHGVLADEPADLSYLIDLSIQKQPVMMRANSTASLNWSRFLDLRDLVLMRGGIRRGERDKTLLWLASTLALSGVVDARNFPQELTDLVQAFPKAQDFDPLGDRSMETLRMRSNAHHKGHTVWFAGREWTPVYTPNNETLIDIFRITDDEMRRMRTIISLSEKQRRADERSPGRAQRRELRRNDACAALALRKDGHSVEQIAQQLQRHPSTVYRWLQPDKRAGQSYVETRGRKQTPRTFLDEDKRKPPRPRRERTRRQKWQHATEQQWDRQKLDEWMRTRGALRQEAQRLAQQAAANNRLWQDKLEQAQLAQVQLRSQARLERMRARACGAQHNRLNACSMYQSVASAPLTGPPTKRATGRFVRH